MKVLLGWAIVVASCVVVGYVTGAAVIHHYCRTPRVPPAPLTRRKTEFVRGTTDEEIAENYLNAVLGSGYL